jgi:hypothetical protein
LMVAVMVLVRKLYVEGTLEAANDRLVGRH